MFYKHYLVVLRVHIYYFLCVLVSSIHLSWRHVHRPENPDLILGKSATVGSMLYKINKDRILEENLPL